MIRWLQTHHRLADPGPSARLRGWGTPREGGRGDKTVSATRAGTYVGDTEQGQQEGAEDNGQCEELTVPVQQLELIHQPCDD